MKDIYDVLRQKELEIERVKREIEALRIVAPMLAEENEQPATRAVAKIYSSSQQKAEAVMVGEEAKAANAWP